MSRGRGGFIQDPATKETKRLHRDEKSWLRDPKAFVDTGFLKTMCACAGTAERLRKELQRVDWQQVDPCWGASAEP